MREILLLIKIEDWGLWGSYYYLQRLRIENPYEKLLDITINNNSDNGSYRNDYKEEIRTTVVESPLMYHNKP